MKLLSRLRQMSPPELAERTRQQLFKLLERVRHPALAHQSSHPALAHQSSHPAVAKRLSGPTVQPIVAGLGARDSRSRQRFALRDDTADAARWLDPRNPSSPVEAADRILSNRFTLLGHPDLDFGNPIDWHLDPVSGKKAPGIHWSRIPYLNAGVVGDHKVVWEINRHQHFYVLGRAWRLTKDEKYARRFAEHLQSWMDQNPPKAGINWASSLEVAYRAIAWLWAFELFQGSPSLTPNVLSAL